MIAQTLNVPFEDLCEVTEDRLGQDSRYWIDSSCIRNDIGWEPEVDWSEGLEEMVAWAHKYYDTLKDWPTEYLFRG
jgi:dTDP-glucose 4,6-dehydratase